MPLKFKFQIRHQGLVANYSAHERKRAKSVFNAAKARGVKITFHTFNRPMTADEIYNVMEETKV